MWSMLASWQCQRSNQRPVSRDILMFFVKLITGQVGLDSNGTPTVFLLLFQSLQLNDHAFYLPVLLYPQASPNPDSFWEEIRTSELIPCLKKRRQVCRSQRYPWQFSPFGLLGRTGVSAPYRNGSQSKVASWDLLSGKSLLRRLHIPPPHISPYPI